VTAARAGIGGPCLGTPFDKGVGAPVRVPVSVVEDSNEVESLVEDGDEETDGALEEDADFVVAGLVLTGVGSGGSDVERVPTVMVDSTVVECEVAVPDPVAEWVRDGGIGIEEVASGRGLSKEPVILSMLKKGENAMYGVLELSLNLVEMMPM